MANDERFGNLGEKKCRSPRPRSWPCCLCRLLHKPFSGELSFAAQVTHHDFRKIELHLRLFLLANNSQFPKSQTPALLCNGWNQAKVEEIYKKNQLNAQLTLKWPDKITRI